MKVLLGPSTFAEKDEAPLKKLAAAGCEVVPNPYKRKLTKAELLTLLTPDVNALIAGLEPLDREVLERSKLKVISRCGSGMSNVDVTAAEKLGIKVLSTPDGPTQAVAELTLGAALSLLRAIPRMDRDLHDKKWSKRIGLELRGKKVAIIGYGRIGRKVASLFSAFGAEILPVDPAVKEAKSLEDALKQADLITLHSSGENVLLGAREFGWMKEGVFVLNAARGGLIDEASLRQALDAGKVAGAWIDTFAEEPYSGPLCGYDQVLLTPHVGSYTEECRRSMEMEAVDNLLNGLKLS